MVKLLQEKANVAGCHVVSYELADLQYAPEIAPGMLVCQQAKALVDACNSKPYLFHKSHQAPSDRHSVAPTAIVEGAVQIVTSAVGRLAEDGFT